ncbi:hypothetical protein ACLB2K_016597 [Fragaria x ananassa]
MNRPQQEGNVVYNESLGWEYEKKTEGSKGREVYDQYTEAIYIKKMSEKIGAADSSYDTVYQPKPSCNFFEEAIKAILKCLGVEAPSNTNTTTEQVVGEPPVTEAEPVPLGVVRPGPTPPPDPQHN